MTAKEYITEDGLLVTYADLCFDDLLDAIPSLKDISEGDLIAGTDIIQKYIDRAVSEATKVNVHQLKCWPVAFEKIVDGSKRHDYRKDDRDFTVGDELRHMEWDPETKEYTGRQCSSTVTCISTSDDPWGVPEGYCVMSLSKPFDKRNC